MESHFPGWEDTRGPGAAVGEQARDDLLARLVKNFEDAEEASADARELAERDRDYYDGNQLTDAEIQELERRGQPVIIINRIKRKIDYLLGHERASRTDPKALPRTQHEEGGAEAATDALRYVCDAERFDVKRSAVWENLLIEGYGGVEVGIRYDSKGDAYPTVTHVPWDRLFVDPHSRMPDFSDARYLGIVIWADEEEVLERWPDAAVLVSTMLDRSASDTFDDRPKDSGWADRKRRRVRVVQMYYIHDGQWSVCFFMKSGMLEEAKPVEYLDDEGRPECPLILQSAYINRDNDRYGVVREMIGPQDEVNKRRSKALHLISVRQTVGEIGAVADVRAMKRELARPDGHVEIAPQMRFEVLPTSDMAQAQFELLQEAKSEIELIGPNAAMMGKDDKAPSGRAILASQQGGQIELGPLSDALRQWQWRVFRQMWNRIRQYWDNERWIRVTDDEESLKWIGLNHPLTLGEKLETDEVFAYRVNQTRAQLPPEMQQQFDMELQASLGTIVEIENEVAAMDIDISLEDQPDVVSLMAEQFDQLAKLATALPGIIPPDALIEASALRKVTKRKLSERMQQAQAAPPPDPMQQQAQMLTLAKGEAEVRKLNADAMKAELDGQARMLEAQTPEPVPLQPGPTDITTPLDQAEQLAKIELTKAQTYKTYKDADKPPPQPALARPAAKPAPRATA